jgi:hypothetical protein
MSVCYIHQPDQQSFESLLLSYLMTLPSIKGGSDNESYSNLSVQLSMITDKKVEERNIVYYHKGERYAKKWLITAMFTLALKNDWLPEALADWQYLADVLIKKGLSVLKCNEPLCQKLSELSSKPIATFNECFTQTVPPDVK